MRATRATLARRAASAAHAALVLSAAGYVVWVLLGTVAWISHLGRRAPWLAPYLLARGHPGNPPADGLLPFFARNVPPSLAFVLPHSLLTPARLHRAPRLRRHARLLYNVIAAATLHLLLRGFTPLDTPVVMILPIPETAHAALSVGCLAFAAVSFVAHPNTWGLLGVGGLLRWSEPYRTNPEKGMDAITWMGATAWKGGAAVGGPAFGAATFVLFTGLSIVPARLTLGDCLTRCVAAVYLRQRSKSFRQWVDRVEGAHLLTWVMRGGLLAAAASGGGGGGDDEAGNPTDAAAMSPTTAMACAAILAGILRVAEGHGRGRGTEDGETDETERTPVETKSTPAAKRVARRRSSLTSPSSRRRAGPPSTTTSPRVSIDGCSKPRAVSVERRRR